MGAPAMPDWAHRPANLSSALVAELVGRIVHGQLPPDTVLPPEPALCETCLLYTSPSPRDS